ncbi:7-ethoxycoumarin O-deethylase-like protein, partial [Tanacetum coccineum]
FLYKQESSSKSRQARVDKKETGGKQETAIDEKAENTVKECTNWKDKKKDKEQEALLISEDTAFVITGENIGPKPNPGPDSVKQTHDDLFVAGTDTTASTLEWAMTEVLANPHIMAKAKDEFSQVIGKGKILDENDVLRLPYLQNIVKETLRIHAPVPLMLPRKLQSQIELNGYMICW